jgi:5-methylcytosine-specific restriction endonuclease McrA
MKSKPKQDRAWLLATAKALAEHLKPRSEGTRLRVRTPSRATTTNTDGWSAIIGDLGRGQPRLEVWFDRFSGYPRRKLYACFRSEIRRQVTYVTKRAARKLWPARVVTVNDTEENTFLALAKRLARSEFNTPVLEKYKGGRTFYGIYDPTRGTAGRVRAHFCTRAAAFFEDVARALPHATAEDEQQEVYPRFENRKRVGSHLHRERSKLLAAECKIRDEYKCQVCGFCFAHAYGRLGSEFAEAHHLVPLGQLRGSVRTRLEDLTTVCANCHRILHRMNGRRDDVNTLRSSIRRRRAPRK